MCSTGMKQRIVSAFGFRGPRDMQSPRREVSAATRDTHRALNAPSRARVFRFQRRAPHGATRSPVRASVLACVLPGRLFSDSDRRLTCVMQVHLRVVMSRPDLSMLDVCAHGQTRAREMDGKHVHWHTIEPRDSNPHDRIPSLSRFV